MGEFIALEFRFLLWSLCCGAMLGAMYNVITIFRHLVPHHRFFCGVEDVLYWFVSSFIMFAVILVANDGAVRWFAVAGMVFGMVIISFILKYLEKGITIIYYKIRKVREGTDDTESCKTKQHSKG